MVILLPPPEVPFGRAQQPARLTLSVIIPVFNGGSNFHRCLSSLAEAVPPPEEIIVVADGDTDGSSHLAESFATKVVRIPTPNGPARARNLGARSARGDLLFFMDADVTIPPDLIGRVAAHFREDPGLAALFGSYDDEPFERNFLSQYKNLFHHYVHQTSREEASTFWAGCGAIRREVFMSLGGFDEDYRQPSVEDIELGYRLKRAGYRVHLVKRLQVKHLKRWRAVSLLKADFFGRALPWTRLIARDRRMISDLNLGYSSRISVGLVYGLLAALIGAWRWPSLLVIAFLFVLCLLVLNGPFYRFFVRKRGVEFALKAVACHWAYYLYSGLAFALGLGQSLVLKRKSIKSDLQPLPK